MQNLCGWSPQPEEVDRVCQTMPNPMFESPSPDQNLEVFNHLLFKKVTGNWQTQGYQKIGDCVSWGHGGMCDYSQVMDQIYDTNPSMELDFEPTATEVIYGISRVDVGHSQIRGDGSVGAWAMRGACDFGNLSRPHLARLGLSAEYDPNRAREWGQNGIPENLKPQGHKFVEGTLVKDALSAAWHIQNGRTVAVCSNVGFANDRSGTRRDEDGFVKPNGNWGHCMKFTSVRWGRRPGLLLENQWPTETTFGPMGPVEIPPCSWWVDMETADAMLRQGDSWTGSIYNGYPVRKLQWHLWG